MDWYQFVLAIHVFGSVLLIGSMVSVALWKGVADQFGDPERALIGTETATRSDWTFFVPGVLTVLVSGLVLTVMRAWDIRSHGWLLLGMVLLVGTVALWLFVLLPRQRAMADIARRSRGSGRLDVAYAELARGWAIAGGIATLLPIVALFLMILKPF